VNPGFQIESGRGQTSTPRHFPFLSPPSLTSTSFHLLHQHPIEYNHTGMAMHVLIFFVAALTGVSHGFATNRAFLARNSRQKSHLFSTVQKEARRKELLTRKGPHFELDSKTGKIEFGATAYLTTNLCQDADLENISSWLQDERGIALSIWDEKLTKDMGSSVYRLQIMTIQFVTLQLSPWVDMEMKTLTSRTDAKPVFCLQSVGFEPNVQILPGMRISAESLGIVIEVSGQLRPSKDAKGVSGAIAFQTSGELPSLLRLSPPGVLKAASDSISRTVINFATKSFQKGAVEQYNDFLRKQS
jgi:hypothetical protein